MKPFIIVLISSFTFLQAQEHYNFNNLNKEMRSIPYIYEGYVLGLTPYLGNKKGEFCAADKVIEYNNSYQNVNGEELYAYFSIEMQVCKVYRGKKLQTGTIELISSNFDSSPIRVIIKNEGEVKTYGIDFSGARNGAEEFFIPWVGGHYIIAGHVSNYKKGSKITQFENSLVLQINDKYTIGLNLWQENKKFTGATIGTTSKCFYEFKSEKEFIALTQKIKNWNHQAKNVCSKE